MYNRGCNSVQKMYYSPEKKTSYSWPESVGIVWVPECVSAVSFNLCTGSRWFPPPGTSWSQRPPTPYCATMCCVQAAKGPDHRHAHTRKHTLVSLCSTSCIWTITKAARWSGVRLDLYQLSDWKLPPTGNGLQHEGVLQRLHTLTFTQSRCPKLFFFFFTLCTTSVFQWALTHHADPTLCIIAGHLLNV